MTEKINSYFAVLLITVTGAGAALFIIHVAYSDTLIATIFGSEAAYAPLQRAILKP